MIGHTRKLHLQIGKRSLPDAERASARDPGRGNGECHESKEKSAATNRHVALMGVYRRVTLSTNGQPAHIFDACGYSEIGPGMGMLGTSVTGGASGGSIAGPTGGVGGRPGSGG